MHCTQNIYGKTCHFGVYIIYIYLIEAISADGQLPTHTLHSPLMTLSGTLWLYCVTLHPAGAVSCSSDNNLPPHQRPLAPRNEF